MCVTAIYIFVKFSEVNTEQEPLKKRHFLQNGGNKKT